MEGGAGDEIVILRAVEKISREGMSQMGHVDADLVGAAGVQTKVQQGAAVFFRQNPVVGTGVFAVRAYHLLH